MISTDIWALGVIMYVLCCCHFPYVLNKEEANQPFLDWTKFRVKYDSKNWSHISDQAKELISGMMILKPEDRLNIEQVINSKWSNMWRNGGPGFSLRLYSNKIQKRSKELSEHIENIYNEVRIRDEVQQCIRLKSINEVVNPLLQKRLVKLKNKTEYQASDSLVTSCYYSSLLSSKSTNAT